MIFLGFHSNSRGYIVYVPKYNLLKVVRTIVFEEKGILSLSCNKNVDQAVREHYQDLFINSAVICVAPVRSIKKLHILDQSTLIILKI